MDRPGLGGPRPVRADHRADDHPRRRGGLGGHARAPSALHRKIDELAAYLFREDEFPAGVVLSTGTSLVPDLPFTLEAGDEVRIRISGIGELVNPVVRGKAAVAAAAHSMPNQINGM